MTAKHRSVNNVFWTVVAGRIGTGHQLDNPDVATVNLTKRFKLLSFLQYMTIKINGNDVEGVATYHSPNHDDNRTKLLVNKR